MRFDPLRAPDPLRIVLVNNFYPPYLVGGGEIVVWHLARELAATGVDVTVVTTCAPRQGMHEEAQDGVHVVRFFPRNLWWSYARFRAGEARSLPAKLVWMLRDAWNHDAAAKFGAVLDTIAPDLVHTHNIRGLSPAIWAEAQRRGLPVVHTLHNYHLLCRRSTMLDAHGMPCGGNCLGCRLYRRWYCRLGSEVDLLCSPSRHVLSLHERAGLTVRLGQHVVRNGLPRPARLPQRPENAVLRLLFSCQLHPVSGLLQLLEAMRLLQGPVALHIVGRGPLGEVVRRAVADDPRIVFHGFLATEERQREFALCDAVLFPSALVECTSLVIAEAFLHGRPVIGSDQPPLEEIVTHGVNGLLFEAGKPASLAAAIAQLAGNRALLRTLSQGAEEAASTCTTQAMTASYRGLYEFALEQRRMAA